MTRLCEIAGNRFSELAANEKDFEVLPGFYDETLPLLVRSQRKFDIVFIDGNHRYEPTVKYFDLLKNSLSDRAILIFDDINWSDGMVKAWKVLKRDPDICCAIDMIKQGILVYQKGPLSSNKVNARLMLTIE